MPGIQHVCADCNQPFSSWNPFAKQCPKCRNRSELLEFVAVASTQNELEANIWRDLLQKSGVQFGFRPIAASRSMQSAAAFEVWVRQVDADRVLKLLNWAGTAEQGRQSRVRRRHRRPHRRIDSDE